MACTMNGCGMCGFCTEPWEREDDEFDVDLAAIRRRELNDQIYTEAIRKWIQRKEAAVVEPPF